MSSLSAKCGGGGWTLVMKLDGYKVKNIMLKKFAGRATSHKAFALSRKFWYLSLPEAI